MSDGARMPAAERRALLSQKSADEIAAFSPSGNGSTGADGQQPRARNSKAPGSRARASKMPPTIGKTYHIKLCSDHWGSKPGGFLDAHRSDKKGKDKLSDHATYVIVHDKADEPTDNLAGAFLLEALDSATLAELPANFRDGSNCFRIKLTTGHYGCPPGLYLCGTDRRSNAKLDKADVKSMFRNDNSSWTFVQPLSACGQAASSVWTIEPADGRYAVDGRWKIRLVTERKGGSSLAPAGSRSYLEVHCSEKKDKRSDVSTFVNLHIDCEGCVGEWSFHEVPDDTTTSPLMNCGRSLLRSAISDDSSTTDSISTVLKGALPNIGKTFRIRLNTSHFKVQAGMYLDAHQSSPRDQLNEESSFALVHNASADTPDGYAGHWHLECLTEEELWTLPTEFSNGNNCFRMKLQTSHFGCPRSLYLSGATADDVCIMDDNEGKPLRRNKHSTWAFVQPLWCCGGLTSNIWTLEPADEIEGSYKLRLVTERRIVHDKFISRTKSMDALEAVMAGDEDENERVFLEVHSSSSRDARNADSNYAIIHSEFDGCVGEWSFEEVHDPYADSINRRDEEYTEDSFVGRQLLRQSIGGPGLAAEEEEGNVARKPMVVQMLPRHQKATEVAEGVNTIDSASQEQVERKAMRRKKSIEDKRGRYLAKKAAIIEMRKSKQEAIIKRRMKVEAKRSMSMIESAAASAGHLWEN